MKILKKNRKYKQLATAMTLASVLVMPATHGYAADSDAPYMKEVNSYLEEGESNSAIITLKNVLQKNPKNAHARLILSNIYLALGNMPAAEKEITQAYTLNPDDPKTNIAFAKTLLAKRQLKELENIIENTQDWPIDQKIEAYILKSQADTYRGNLAFAEESLEQASQLAPNKPTVLFHQALLETQRRDIDKAKGYLSKLFEQDPNNFKGQLLQGEIALEGQDYPLAIQSFESAIKTQPKVGSANISLAKALIADNQLEKATKQLQKVLDFAPNHPDATALQAKIEFTNRHFEKASQYAEANLANSENNTEVLYIAAASYYALNRYESAYSQISKVLARHQNHGESLKLKAAIELKLGLTDAATSTLSQINNESLKASDDQLLIAAGLASLQDKDYSAGKRLFKQASDLNSQDPRVNLGQATVAALEGDSSTTIKELEAALQKSPDSEQTQTALILTYLQNKQPNKALEHAEKFILNHPQNPNGQTFKGLSYVMQKDLTNAETAFKQALSIEPGNPNASHNLAAIIKRQNNDIKKIRALHEDVLKLNPDNLNSLIELSLLDQAAGEYENAAQRLKQAIDAHPSSLRPQIILSAIYMNQKKIPESLEISELALKNNPDNPGLLTLAGKAQQMSEKPDIAIDYYTKAITIAPNAFMPHFLLSEIYQRQNQLNQSEEHIDIAIALAPEHLGARLIKAQLSLRTGNIEGAKSIAEQLKEVDPENSYITELQAQIAATDNDLDTAATLYKEVLSKRENAALNIQLASVLWQQSGKKTEAYSTLTQWIDKNPADLLSRNVLATFYLQDQQADKAILQFSEIVKLTPDNSTAHNNLAWLLLQRNDITTAEIHAQKANKLKPNNPLIMDTLGTVLMQKGDLPSAEKLLVEASSILPANLEIQYHLAQVNFKAGKKEQSEAILTELLSSQHATEVFSEREDAQKMLKEIQNSQ